jgi:hypothetical protein
MFFKSNFVPVAKTPGVSIQAMIVGSIKDAELGQWPWQAFSVHIIYYGHQLDHVWRLARHAPQWILTTTNSAEFKILFYSVIPGCMVIDITEPKQH